MTPEFIASLREEMRQMIRAAIEANPYGYIVALEDDETGIADSGRGNDAKQTDDQGT